PARDAAGGIEDEDGVVLHALDEDLTDHELALARRERRVRRAELSIGLHELGELLSIIGALVGHLVCFQQPAWWRACLAVGLQWSRMSSSMSTANGLFM